MRKGPRRPCRPALALREGDDPEGNADTAGAFHGGNPPLPAGCFSSGKKPPPRARARKWFKSVPIWGQGRIRLPKITCRDLGTNREAVGLNPGVCCVWQR
jgi:hypothetical protein